ncbi:magnesium transporter CorA family protein [Parvibaculum sp.]|uniref:magnesium transporter CorA family protein n=1 Tax=Parvibaculum sp. TaxID=2024848 RepID=UPI003919B50B
MITAYVPVNGTLTPVEVEVGSAIPADAVWIDLLQPTEEEMAFVDVKFSLDVPTEEDMQEIEVSSRLYVEDEAVYMTATMVTQADTPMPQVVPVTFVLAGHRLLTLRYAEPTPFRHFAAEARRHSLACASGEEVLAGLLDAITDRIADILERIQSDIDGLSHEIFGQRGGKQKRNYDDILRRIGRSHSLTSQLRESLVSFVRMVSFIARPSTEKRPKSTERAFKTISRDLTSLSDHASFIANNTSFILNATLGLISNEQSGIIKIFSVAAVVFLPPTLIASIYGMNFEFMPELAWPLGYPMALVAMVFSAVGPYLFFKYRGWL